MKCKRCSNYIQVYYVLPICNECLDKLEVYLDKVKKVEEDTGVQLSKDVSLYLAGLKELKDENFNN